MKHRIRGRLLAALLSVVLLCACLVIPGYAREKTLSTDKTTYIQGENIVVTAYGEGKDWVGLYLPGDTLGSDASIYWYYVEGKEEAVLTEAGETNASRAPYFDIPVGDYRLYLLANDGYEILDTVDISVIPDPNAPVPDAPASAVYERTALLPGLAQGKVTITEADSGTLPDRYELYWGNADGILPDYTALARINRTGSSTVYELEESTMFPQEADRILVSSILGYKTAEALAEIPLPADRGAMEQELGELRYELQVVSDIHITPDQSHIHNRHFAALLEDIKANSPDSIGLFVNGDIANSGSELEYQNMQAIIRAAGKGIPKLYFAMGNHDYFGTSDARQIQLFLQYTGTEGDTPYHDLWLEGVHFIFLAGERDCDNADLSQAQLDWLREKLNENRDVNRPIYLFLHQGIKDTVAGCFAYQKWHGVIQEKELSAILKEYPEVMMFSGHSHWEMDSPHTMKARDENLPTIFNTAAGAYLWNDDCMATDIGLEGSQCYYFYAYDQGIVVRGRDVANGKWIGSTIYFVDYGASGTPVDALVEAPAAEETTAASASDAPAESTSEAAASTTAPTDPAPAKEAKKAAPAIWIAAGAAAVLLAAGAVVLLRRKKH